MSSLLPNFIADVTTMPWVAIIAVGGGILLTIVVIVGGLMIAYHRQKQWHETARLALEKGQPMPAPPDASGVPAQPEERGPGQDLRAGLICLGVGVGLYLFFDALLGRWMAYVGAIPGFIGVALIIYALGAIFFSRKDQPRS